MLGNSQDEPLVLSVPGSIIEHMFGCKTDVSDGDRVVAELQHAARRVASAQAEMYAAMVVVARAVSVDDGSEEFAADEIRAALTSSLQDSNARIISGRGV